MEHFELFLLCISSFVFRGDKHIICLTPALQNRSIIDEEITVDVTINSKAQNNKKKFRYKENPIIADVEPHETFCT